MTIKTDDNFFEISFKDSETNRLLNLYTEHKDTYGQNENKEEIDEVLSHLVALDAARKEKIKNDGNIDFTISYGLNGKRVEESMSVPLGMGHFGKGINHLRENFGANLESNIDSKQEKDNTSNRLDKICSALKMPPKLALGELDEKGWDTIGKMADLAKGLSSPELAGFLAGFQGAIREAHHKTPSNQAEMDNNKFAQLMSKKLNISPQEAKQIIDNAQNQKDTTEKKSNTESKIEVSQEKIDEIKKKSEIAIKNQKKVKVKQGSEAIRIQV
ncbi:hypothetical protein [Helicobacter cinaedi]|uniref:hypothetical protein n=1 Tax=Helicobacter cinaedi TaxID=213 RepID=UPI000D7C3BE1|nr:hypothetical protein [Helicobacter cinaedi]